MSKIQINVLEKKYVTAGQDYCTIANLHLNIKTNEFVCLVGPSGCGKTTLLNLISGLDHSFEGKIDIQSHLMPPHIGYVFQNPRLLPWRTVRENIELVVDSPSSMEMIDEILSEMQLQDMADAYPQHLSLGMQRRAAIARAFAVNPDILMMDEPFVSLDAPTARQIRQSLYGLWQKRPHTILFVSHDLREAISLADRLVFLSHAPTKVIETVTVNISRPDRQDEKKIESFRKSLLEDYPSLKSLL